MVIVVYVVCFWKHIVRHMQMHFELYNKLPKVCFRICVLSSGWKNSREACTLTGQWFLSQPLTAVAMKGVDACGRKPKIY